MKSMTGYGKAAEVRDGNELTVELKSVNHRFLDISTKIPRMFIAYEDVIRSGLAKGLSRGHIDVYLNYANKEGNAKKVAVDTALAAGYVGAAKELSNLFPELKNDFQISSLLRTPDVISLEQCEESEEALRDMLTRCVEEAVCNLNIMRENEGEKLKADITSRLEIIEKQIGQVSLLAPSVAAEYAAKLKARISEALENVEIDQARLLSEVAFFTDKSNIDEEITRLKSHIVHAREIILENDSVGRKLDFLVQEFNRETNTICSKSCNVELTNVALAMKNEIEKVREQVQNLE